MNPQAPFPATVVELTPAAVVAAAALIPEKSPVFMVNLVRYHPQATYEDQSKFAPCSGQEAYLQRYAPAFNQIAEALGITGIQPVFVGGALSTLVALPGESWDNVVVVKYPSFAALRQIIEHPRYEVEAAPHRRAALADWRFIATTDLTAAATAAPAGK